MDLKSSEDQLSWFHFLKVFVVKSVRIDFYKSENYSLQNNLSGVSCQKRASKNHLSAQATWKWLLTQKVGSNQLTKTYHNWISQFKILKEATLSLLSKIFGLNSRSSNVVSEIVYESNGPQLVMVNCHGNLKQLNKSWN